MTTTTTRTTRPARPARRRAPDWLVPTSLIVLSAVPVLVGGLRLTSLTGAVDTGGTLGPAPAPAAALVLHIVTVTLYSLLGALQLHRGLRARRPGWHRWSGRVTAPAGLLAALTGVWLTVASLGDGDHPLLVVTRFVVGAVMAVAIVVGVRAAVRRDHRRHRAWMLRAYALGLGAGTQVVVVGGGGGALGDALTPLVEALLFALSWGINLAVAERAIRRG